MEEIGKILPKALQPQFSRLEPPVVEVLAPLWSRVAGKVLAKECRPVAFSAGTLTLTTVDPDWVVPLQQMTEEIRAHVNNFLGRPVVRHLRISCIHKLSHGGRSVRQPDDLPASKAKRMDCPRQGPGLAPGIADAIGRPRAKDLARKGGKVH